MKNFRFHILLATILLPLIGLQSCSESTSPEDGGFSDFPVLLLPKSVENKSELKVLVPDGSGGWTDVTAQVSEIPCKDDFDELGEDVATDGGLRLTSATEFEAVDPENPTSVVATGTYTINDGVFSFPVSLFGFTSTIYGRKDGDDLYAPNIMVCQIADDGINRSQISITLPIESTTADLSALNAFEGDTVVYQTYEVKYEQQ